jgi:hypothetical protein
MLAYELLRSSLSCICYGTVKFFQSFWRTVSHSFSKGDKIRGSRGAIATIRFLPLPRKPKKLQQCVGVHLVVNAIFYASYIRHNNGS